MLIVDILVPVLVGLIVIVFNKTLKRKNQTVVGLLKSYYHESVIFSMVVVYYTLLFASFRLDLRILPDYNILVFDPVATFIANTALLMVIVSIRMPDPKNLDISSDKLIFSDAFLQEKKSEVKIFIDRNKTSLKYFRAFWTITMVILLLFYVYSAYCNIAFGDVDYYHRGFISNLSNTLSSLAFLGCLYIVSVPTFKEMDFCIPKSYMRFGVLCLVVLFVDLTNRSLSESSIITTNFTLIFIIAVLIGSFSSIIIALFIGRLDSMFLKTDLKLVIALYFYAFLLVAYPILSNYRTGIVVSNKLSTEKINTVSSSERNNASPTIDFSKHNTAFVDSVITSYEEILTTKEVLNAQQIDVYGKAVHRQQIYKMKSMEAFLNNVITSIYHLSFVFKALLAIFLIRLFKSNKISYYLISMNIIEAKLYKKINKKLD